MKFDQLVQSILVEKRCEGSLPELTSKREVYTMTVYTDAETINPNPWKLQEGQLQDWDDNYKNHSNAMLYWETPTFNEALNHFKTGYTLFKGRKFNSPIGKLLSRQLSTHIVQTITDRIGNLQGNWKVINSTEGSDSLTIGVEIDMEHYRTQGIQDAVASNLDDGSQDISDW